jgi:uncharacterized protein
MKYQTKEQLAKAVVEKVVKEGIILEVKEVEVKEELRQVGGCFVTLYVNGKLHGCIGTIEARKPLYLDIVENAVGAAVRDYRFPRLERSDLDKLRVEVSVLTPLRDYRPESTKALLEYLQIKQPGLVIQKWGQQAVFLPQVWKQLPGAEQFLEQLSLKAGLPAEAWREGMRFKVFEVK